MKKLSVFLGLATMLLLLFSCENETVEKFDSIQDYLDSRVPQAETFQLDGNTGGTFTTTKGSILYFPPNSLVTASGQAVSGNVTVKMKEIFSKSEMIYSGVLPTSYGSPLKSGGQFFVEATQNSEQLLVRDGELITVTIPAQAEDPGMMLFLGDDEELVVNDSLNTWDWGNPIAFPSDSLPSDSTNNEPFIYFDPFDYTFTTGLDSMGWVNCDAWYYQDNFICTFNLNPRTDLELVNNNTSIYAIYNGDNSMMPSQRQITDNTTTIHRLINESMTILTISLIDDQFYYGLLDLTPVAGQEYDIDILPTTAEDLEDIINGL